MQIGFCCHASFSKMSVETKWTRSNVKNGGVNLSAFSFQFYLSHARKVVSNREQMLNIKQFSIDNAFGGLVALNLKCVHF